MIVTYICGHEENVRVTSKAHKEEVQAYAATNKCSACAKIDIAAQPRKSELTIPQLTGTEKQVAWANDIRAKVIEHKEEILPLLEKEAKGSKAHMANYIMNMLDRFIETETNAAIWIEVFKPITSQYSDKPAHIHIIGGMAQLPDRFGLDITDSNFLYDVGRVAK